MRQIEWIFVCLLSFQQTRSVRDSRNFRFTSDRICIQTVIAANLCSFSIRFFVCACCGRRNFGNCEDDIARTHPRVTALRNEPPGECPPSSSVYSFWSLRAAVQALKRSGCLGTEASAMLRMTYLTSPLAVPGHIRDVTSHASAVEIVSVRYWNAYVAFIFASVIAKL